MSSKMNLASVKLTPAALIIASIAANVACSSASEGPAQLDSVGTAPPPLETLAGKGKPGGGTGGTGGTGGGAPALDYTGYQLVWSDEFDGTALDTTAWTAEIGNGQNGWGNNEMEYYTDSPQNLRLENGELLIEAREESIDNFSYTSARIKTQDKKTFTYGIIEARIKTADGQGLWPAFWMLGSDIPQVGWPACGELDIMENKGTDVMYHYAHWLDDASGAKASYGTSAIGDISEYHVYSARWDESQIEWFVDGVRHHVIDITPSSLSEYHQVMFILLNLAVGGNFTGRPRRTTAFPATMHVDYVRVYQ